MFSACTSIKVAVLLKKIADLPKSISVLSTPFFTFSSFFSGFRAAAIETCSHCRLVLAVRWHHQLDGHESEQTLGDSEGQESLACCSPWDCKELDTAERLNNNNKEGRAA